MAIPDGLLLALTSEDGKTVEADAAVLCGVSSVFRDMLSMPTSMASPASPASDAEQPGDELKARDKITLKLDESADVLERIIDLSMGKQVDLPTCDIALHLVAAVDKYDMPLVRVALLLTCRTIAAALAEDRDADKRGAWIAFLVAAHLDNTVVMTDCLRVHDCGDPTRWTTTQAMCLPFKVYCALTRAWVKTANWNSMTKAFKTEYEQDAKEAVNAFWL